MLHSVDEYSNKNITTLNHKKTLSASSTPSSVEHLKGELLPIDEFNEPLSMDTYRIPNIRHSKDTHILYDKQPIEQYTDNHFMNKLNNELQKLAFSSPSKMFNGNESNSPISISDSDSDDCFEHSELYDPNHELSFEKTGFRKLTYHAVQSSIDKYYDTTEKTCNELDVLSIYLKGQKYILLKGAFFMNLKTIFVLSLASTGSICVIIFWLFVDEHYYPYLSGLNAFVFFLYFLNLWFNWNSYAILYRLRASQYESLSIDSLQPHVNKHNDREHILFTLQKIEEKLREWGDCSLPWECYYLFPILSNIQLFTFIKRIESYKKNLILKFKDIKNEIRYIQWKWGDNMSPREKSRFNFLCYIKEKIKSDILHYKNAYGEIESFLLKEMSDRFLLSKRNYITENPVVSNFFVSIFGDN